MTINAMIELLKAYEFVLELKRKTHAFFDSPSPG